MALGGGGGGSVFPPPLEPAFDAACAAASGTAAPAVLMLFNTRSTCCIVKSCCSADWPPPETGAPEQKSICITNGVPSVPTRSHSVPSNPPSTLASDEASIWPGARPLAMARFVW